MTDTPGEFEVDVALSFAGEDGAYVQAVAEKLNERKVELFFSDFSQADLWGRDLYEHLDDVFRKKARFAVVFVSEHYINKPWPRHERQSAQARAFVELEPYFLPVRLDDSELPGLRPTVHYIDARRVSIDDLVNLILAKLGRETGPTPAQTRLLGVPRTPAQEDELLQLRPPGWEYLLFAGVLVQGKESLESKWRDHEIGYIRQGGPRLRDNEAADFISAAMAEAQIYAGNLDRTLDARIQEQAFGRPGEPGDPDRIKHLAERIVSMYEDFLDWAACIRAVQVSDRFRRAVELAAAFLDQPLNQVRAFVDRCVAEIDRLPSLLANGQGKPIRIELTLKLDIDQATVRAFHKEMKRLRRGRS